MTKHGIVQKRVSAGGKAVADQDNQYDTLILSCGAIETW